MPRPRRAVVYVLAWLAAAGASVLVASQGVALVGRQVTDRRPSSLNAAQIEDQLAALEQGSTSELTVPTSDPTTATTTTSSTTPDAPSTTETPAPPSTTRAPTTQATTVGSPATTAPTSTTSPPPAAETRTYSVQGGTVSLRFTSSGVTVVFANPAAGFDVDVEPEHVNGVKVEFESDAHRSRVDGWWEGGPVDRVREEDR